MGASFNEFVPYRPVAHATPPTTEYPKLETPRMKLSTPCTSALRLAVWPAGLLLLFLLGCGADSPRQAGALERDSAGIRVVENNAPLYTEANAWRLSTEPLLEIGVLEGPAVYQFHGIAGAVRLSDGRIAAADGGSREIRVFDPLGMHLVSGGGQGGGPGEFEAIAHLLRLDDDSLLVYDSRLNRLTVLDDEARLVRDFALAAVGNPAPTYVDAFSDGLLLLRAPRDLPSNPPTRSTTVRDTSVYFLFDTTTEQADTLGAFPGQEAMIRLATSGGELTSVEVLKPAYFPREAIGSAGPFAYQAESKRYEFAFYARDGHLVRLVRRHHNPQPVSTQYLDEYHRATLSDDAPERVNPYTNIPRPETLPVFRTAMSDAEGNLWVELFQQPAVEHSTWDVFDPDGRWVTTLNTPPRFAPTDIGHDFVLGVWTDDFDVQRIRLHTLEKPQPGDS